MSIDWSKPIVMKTPSGVYPVAMQSWSNGTYRVVWRSDIFDPVVFLVKKDNRLFHLHSGTPCAEVTIENVDPLRLPEGVTLRQHKYEKSSGKAYVRVIDVDGIFSGASIDLAGILHKSVYLQSADFDKPNDNPLYAQHFDVLKAFANEVRAEREAAKAKPFTIATWPKESIYVRTKNSKAFNAVACVQEGGVGITTGYICANAIGTFLTWQDLADSYERSEAIGGWKPCVDSQA